MPWLEVSLTVSGEVAEAVADALARFAPEGVVTESLAVPAFENGEGRADLGGGPVAVRAYLPYDDRLEDKRARLEQDLWHLGQLAGHSGLSIPEPAYRNIAETDWAEKWKENFRPIRVGRRLVVVPAWLTPDLAPDEVALRLDPGMAFGTGTHPTTQLCLAALEDYLHPGEAVLDLGAGSGILSIAAAKLGASPVLARDIDPEAVRVAGENVAANGVGDVVRVELGSVSESLPTAERPRCEVERVAHGLRPAPQRSGLVIANILSSVIIKLLREGLAQTVAPGGVLILSGILESQAKEVESAVRAAGMEVKERRQMGEWVAIVASGDIGG